MADKCDTYYCSWRREADGIVTGWEVRRPALTATAKSPRELQRALGKAIVRHYDDQEAALHFDPPLFEVGDPEWYVDELMEIAWNASFTFSASAPTAYAHGRCERCGGGLGARTGAPLAVDSIAEPTDGAFSSPSNEPPPWCNMPAWLMIVSEAFLNALTDEERTTFGTRRVDRQTKSGRRFHELVPHSLVPLGAVKGVEVTGWRCGRCDRRLCSLGRGINVVCRDRLPECPRGFFFAGGQSNVHLYCSRKRWQSLAGTNSARKLTGSRLAVVDGPQFDADPRLGTLDEIERFRREHGFKVPFEPTN